MTKTVGEEIVGRHLADMNGASRRKWAPIVEVEGFRIVEDRAYQGFDAGVHPWWTEPRFWCRSITVERLSDGRRGWSVGPQADAYAQAVRNVEKP